MTLQDLCGDRAAEVLPTLDSLFLQCVQPSGSVQDAIQPFVTARQLSGHHVAVDTIGAILDKDIIMLSALHDINCTYLSYSDLSYDSSDAPTSSP